MLEEKLINILKSTDDFCKRCEITCTNSQCLRRAEYKKTAQLLIKSGVVK